MGDRQPRRTAEQSPGWHGEHAHHHACAAESCGSEDYLRRFAVFQRRHSETATRNPHRERRARRRDRKRNRAVDRAGVTETMDNILFLAHTEADGTLNKAALEALSSAVELKQASGGTLDVALFGAQVQPAANSIAACGATRFLAVAGEAFGPARFATDAAASEALVRASGATIVIAAATSRSSRVMAAVAHRANGCVDTHVN